MQFEEFLTGSGRVNSLKLRESWLSKNVPEFLSEVKEYCERASIIYEKPAEAVWHYFNKSIDTVVCKHENCSAPTKFLGILNGYSEYCSSKCSNSSTCVKKKKVQTSMERYGVENPYQSNDVINKIKQTNISKYGVDNPMKSAKIKTDMINRSISKTGMKWALSKGGTADLTKREKAKSEFIEKYSNLEIIEYSDEKFGECTLYRKSCGHEFVINKWQLHQRSKQGVDVCTVCNPIGSFNETVWHLELAEFLSDLNIEFKQNDRSTLGNLELDFYIPHVKVAIELNGLYWHSIDFKNPNYHLLKTERCEELGIQLIHIFEDEWIHKKDIVKSRLMNLLNLLKDNRIYARKCIVKQIDGTVAKAFIDANHIQGNVPASKRFGLFYNDELVSVMTFGALRRALGSSPIDRTYEMYRFCNKINYVVIGAASKLLKAFIESEKPIEIISYADRRWSTGKLYNALGFELIGSTRPNFWWVSGDRRLHRFNYSNKKSIESKDLTKIFDSGNLKFRLSI